MRRYRIVGIEVLLCPKRISENECMLFLVVIVGYLKRNWCVSLCCKRVLHMLWHSSYLTVSAFGYDYIHWDCCIVLSLFRHPSNCNYLAENLMSKREKWKLSETRKTNTCVLYFYTTHMGIRLFILCNCIFDM